MFSQLALGAHFLRELAARHYEYERAPEPDLVMDNPDNVREYRDAGLATGNGSSVYLYNMLLLAPAIKPGATIVDLACGPANLLVELASLHPEASFIGVDLSSEMLRCAEELKISRNALNVHFIQGDITRLDGLEGNSADIVMSTLSLHHLPEFAMLRQCFEEIARIVRPTGAIHLMDFASLKLQATTRYFVYERTKTLGPFLAKDYENSLRAAYRVEQFNALLPTLRGAVPNVQLRKTFGVPFLVAATSLMGGHANLHVQRELKRYWLSMLPGQQRDFLAMRQFFQLDGLPAPDPRKFSQ